MKMEDELIKVDEYILDRDIVNKCFEEERELTKEDIEGEIQEILRGNGIECKSKIVENWSPRVTKNGVSKYHLIVEVYVYKKDYEEAIKLLKK